MGKHIVMLCSVLVLAGSPAFAQSLEQKLQAFIAAISRNHFAYTSKSRDTVDGNSPGLAGPRLVPRR